MFNENGYECIFQHHKNVNKSAPLKCKNVNCSQNSINRIIETIDKAQYCIDMAMFTFNSTELFEALKQAMARGVQLRIICENSRAFKAGTSIWMLINLGAMMRGPKSLSLMHHKFCIIDEELRVEEICLERGRRTKPNLCNSCIINGSANWTIRGFGGNWENIVITTNNVMIKELQAEFNRMWKAFTISLEPVEDMKMFA
ncbi:zuc [Drosophila busckii]|uniref:Mitochondrial cardiolipin hydrolase n=2 Tax=Drosophila busckii TaxID=30019 RepID=A0A0M3QWB6_DROBS|nr:zuc [Drosophila busckii]